MKNCFFLDSDEFWRRRDLMSGNSPGGPELKTGGVGMPPSVESGKEIAEVGTGSLPEPPRIPIQPEMVPEISVEPIQPHLDSSANQMQPISVISDQPISTQSSVAPASGPPPSGSEDMNRSNHVVQPHHPHLNQAHRIQAHFAPGAPPGSPYNQINNAQPTFTLPHFNYPYPPPPFPPPTRQRAYFRHTI